MRKREERTLTASPFVSVVELTHADMCTPLLINQNLLKNEPVTIFA